MSTGAREVDKRILALGRRGEDLAVEVLTSGFVVVGRNWRGGEIDIIARDGRERAVVFCEVKCRSRWGYGAPLDSITYAKLRRLRLLIGEWLTAHPGAQERVRLDAIGIVWPSGGEPDVTHVRGVGL